MMVLLSTIFIGPILVMILTSFKTNVEAQSSDPTFLPHSWTLKAYRQLFMQDDASPVLRWLLNSIVSATASAILVCLFASMAAYAFARIEFKGRKILFGIILSTMFVPSFVFLMPNFEIMSKLHWLDTLAAIIFPGTAGAFGVFFLRQFFISLPKEFEESARVDGAGPFKTFFLIVLPNAKGAILTLFILSFLANWNDFVWPIYVLFSDEMLTLPVGLTRLQGSYTIDYPVIMAGASIAAVPVLLLYIILQRYIIDGVASSGLKG
ncbi:carbohydrate ABC transporter permease [uncultured Cutibacterium sp.]|uniref:carbohydrate ABC transporter permease n=1 Tax=uncultured Cutibacterium sp. TaxID=1912223 RepID=UPI002804661E|nr:carbohydrate ABC transporter permease [uncultured Cutibacterium sp.]MDU1580458.1 carbohydrate ABC transporter permease [Cutibacterium granulosum]